MVLQASSQSIMNDIFTLHTLQQIFALHLQKQCTIENIHRSFDRQRNVKYMTLFLNELQQNMFCPLKKLHTC